MKNKWFAILVVTLITILSITACSAGESTGESPSANQAAAESATEVADSSSAAQCPVGTWKLSDLTPYLISLEQNLTSTTGGDFTFSDTQYSGEAQFVFNADQTVEFSATDFNESLTMSTNVGDTSMAIPIKININGTSKSDYSVEGDKISFSNQDNGDMAITMEVMGNSSTIDQSLLGQEGTVQVYQFACSDPDTMTLKVIAIENMDLEPIVLTRVP